jgi:hypothetical protein
LFKDEMEVRSKVLRVFNKTEDDFEDEPEEYDEYLMQIERIVD